MNHNRRVGSLGTYRTAHRVTVYNNEDFPRPSSVVFALIYENPDHAKDVAEYIKRLLRITEREDKFLVIVAEIIIYEKVDMEYLKDLLEELVL